MASPEYAHAYLSRSRSSRWIDSARRTPPQHAASPPPHTRRFASEPLPPLRRGSSVPVAAAAPKQAIWPSIYSSAESIPAGMLGDVLFGTPRDVAAGFDAVSPPPAESILRGRGTPPSLQAQPQPSAPSVTPVGTPVDHPAAPPCEDDDHRLLAPPAPEAAEGATKMQMVFNVLNLYVGLGLLSQAYSFGKGGWVTAGVLSLCALLFSWTGKLIVRCFASVPQGQFADCGGESYPNLGYAAFQRAAGVGLAEGEEAAAKGERWGNYGRRLVTTLSVVEFVGAACMSTIIYWQCAMPLVHLDPLSAAQRVRAEL
eukprot:TRINITY_DN11139_c0_g3_i2.p1 TRINITY_DN11139_c0_g3~~TRINITY_DN11139_c0_g3_i2.p1  ORF type:complete len:334 (+),score=81.95 TRINITY_DN11139_c0_g3_i2:66-1004(+)